MVECPFDHYDLKCEVPNDIHGWAKWFEPATTKCRTSKRGRNRVGKGRGPSGWPEEMLDMMQPGKNMMQRWKTDRGQCR